MAKIDAFFKLMNEQRASDLHLVSGSQPILRVHVDMERIKYKALVNEDFSADKKIIFQGSADHLIFNGDE